MENVKSFTRTNINKPYFTPIKARKSRHIWHFKHTKQNLWGFLWWINVDKLSIYGSLYIGLNLFAHIFPKMACFCYLFWPAKLFTPTAQLVYTDISVISVTFSNSAEWKKCKKHYAGWGKNVRQRRLCVGDAYQLSYCNYHSKNMLRDTPEAAGRFFPSFQQLLSYYPLLDP